MSTELSQLVEPSSELGPLHWLVSLDWIEPEAAENTPFGDRPFSKYFEGHMTRSLEKLSQGFGKALRFFVLTC